MSSIEAKMDTSKLKAKLAKLGVEARGRVQRAMAVGALQIHKDIIDSLTSSGKTGRIYIRGQKYDKATERYHDVTHQASAPGEAPSSDSGELRRKIPPPIKDGDGFTYLIVSKAPYSSYLEFGTSRMAARPFMTPAFQKNKRVVSALVKEAMQEAIKDAIHP